ncbi:ZIP domain-containing protein [Plasmodium berghei]|uniref:Putative metal ion transporter ZIPCO n=2 Tax=Plasmodium berghei TaxID=5821 RepID=ZIPCO_PLABA|nr:ZIP domain-containing protein [Plasmodium berghei ANKA]CXI08355.1 ZIP domain-containing protein [Plasmodium berghei]SCL92716.1 ZIP domain-containing protein [Plasmodium berghei]SCM15701.1 ZIP domain-containing protein [Plasmodium berghei]SCM17495.1 ZIP domain-containing protein [Plasmodium berghei]SCN22888.1 ZIP domain-containing protein [Plasmodium berghei]|eukprot:XP_034420306.1 ZIP domain-containing protein [Plasmodium berghei ANKA]
MWLKLILAIVILIECIVVIYLPSHIESRIMNKKKHKIFNMENFENVASGAILALAFIHMLPEVIGLLNKNNLTIYCCFGLILISVTFLNITDILYDHHTENCSDIDNAEKNTNKFTINSASDKNIRDHIDIEMESLSIKENTNLSNNFIFDTFKSNAFFIVLSLFIHSFVEGLLIGSLKDKNPIIIVGLSMIAHKWAECLMIYKNAVKKTKDPILSSIYAWSFILSLPLGILVAVLSFSSNEFVEIIFSSIACGFFLYLSFNMTKDITVTKANKFYISFSYFFGVCGMSTLMIVFNYLEKSNVV